MKDSFGPSITARLGAFVDQQRLDSLFGAKEQQVLRLFYDERLKVRRQTVPRFHIYAQLCDGKPEADWASIMIAADRALHHLEQIDCIEQAAPSLAGALTGDKVGAAATQYRLTARGVEVLQDWHPSMALRVRAWIALMPPWLVLAGGIAGAVGALWKIAELLLPGVG